MINCGYLRRSLMVHWRIGVIFLLVLTLAAIAAVGGGFGWTNIELGP